MDTRTSLQVLKQYCMVRSCLYYMYKRGNVSSGGNGKRGAPWRLLLIMGTRTGPADLAGDECLAALLVCSSILSAMLGGRSVMRRSADSMLSACHMPGFQAYTASKVLIRSPTAIPGQLWKVSPTVAPLRCPRQERILAGDSTGNNHRELEKEPAQTHFW